MELERPSDASVDWQTLRHEGGSSTLEFVSGKPRHIVVIPDEVLDDGLRTSTGSALSNAKAHQAAVDAAIQAGYDRNDWKELVEIYSGSKLFQLWLTRSDFGDLEP